ncbi:MAG: YitT family protein [Oscillospiraceae bacterium]|nr:YitT family protein [Oscillospiraceae bacterium]
MTLNRKKIQGFITDTVLFIIGGMLYSVAVNCFTSRNDILNGGFTGLATVLNHLLGFPIGTVIFLLNIPLFFPAFKRLGTKFVLRTMWATFIMSAMIDLGTVLPIYGNDLLLSSLFGGVLSGLGLGIVFIRNATTGGTDIIAKLLQLKFPHISIGRSIFIFDLIVIVLGGIVYRNVESMLYAGVVIFVSMQTIDYIIYGANRGTMVMIITCHGETIRELIINELHRGVTVLHGRGGYTDGDREVLLCACYDNQTGKFIKKIKSADESAFFIVTQAKEILGEGFNQWNTK